VPFAAYARTWVRKEIQRAISQQEFPAVLPPDLIGRTVALRRALAENADSLATSAEPPDFALMIEAQWHRKRQRLDQTLDHAVKDAIKTGLLMFNIPGKMVQGQQERVEVKIARAAVLRDELLSGLRGQEEPQLEEIDTSLYMELKLVGPTFESVAAAASPFWISESTSK
jgi:hypothetical protein